MGWLIVGLLIGYGLGRAKRRDVALEALQLAAEKVRTRCAVGARVADKSKAIVHAVAEQAIGQGQVSSSLLADLIGSIEDLNYLASDMIDDHMALLKEVAHGRT